MAKHHLCASLSHPAEDWKAVNEELQKSSRYVIKNQTTGDRLKIRVVAVNAGGRSAPVTLPEPVLVKEVAGKKCRHQQKTLKIRPLTLLFTTIPQKKIHKMSHNLDFIGSSRKYIYQSSKHM